VANCEDNYDRNACVNNYLNFFRVADPGGRMASPGFSMAVDSLLNGVGEHCIAAFWVLGSKVMAKLVGALFF
jgi:hypothetical protein